MLSQHKKARILIAFSGGRPLDSTVRTGAVLIGGLAIAALIVVALVLAFSVPFWAGLILLGVLDITLMTWAYAKLKR
jgi:hypothetical protein